MKVPRTYSALIATLCAAAFLLLTTPAMNAQVQAGEKRPSTVPGEYVVTPFGYFHPTCVKQLAQGDVLKPDEGIIQHQDGNLDSIPACNYPHYDAKGKHSIGRSGP